MGKKGKGKNKTGGKVLRLGGNAGGRFMEVSIAGTGETYRVPLADSLSMGDAMAMRKVQRKPKDKRDEAFFEVFYQMVSHYVPKKYLDVLSMDDFTTLVEAWTAASEEAGAGPGE